MKQFIDFIPLLLFFIVFKLDPRTVEFAGQSIELGGIFSATGVLIASSVVVYGTLFAVQKRLEKGQWLTLAACLLFGGMTLAFHSETFLKWKAPVVNWLFALGFAGSANLFVAFTFQSIWVDFKVFGSLGMTLLFLVGQGIYLSRHLHDEQPANGPTDSKD